MAREEEEASDPASEQLMELAPPTPMPMPMPTAKRPPGTTDPPTPLAPLLACPPLSELTMLCTPSEALLRTDSMLDMAEEQELSPLLKNFDLAPPVAAAEGFDRSWMGFGKSGGGTFCWPKCNLDGFASAPLLITIPLMGSDGRFFWCICCCCSCCLALLSGVLSALLESPPSRSPTALLSICSLDLSDSENRLLGFAFGSSSSSSSSSSLSSTSA